MGFKFRKSIKILPGLRIHLTHKGISSASIGKRGASVNVGKKGARASVGIPGSGLFYSKYRSYTDKSSITEKSTDTYSTTEQQPPSATSTKNSSLWLWIAFGIFCFIVGAVIF